MRLVPADEVLRTMKLQTVMAVLVALFPSWVPVSLQGQQLPDSIARIYQSSNDGVRASLGDVQLSTSSAKFAKLQGAMRLEFDQVDSLAVPGDWLRCI
jgi:hypothetical protein